MTRNKIFGEDVVVRLISDDLSFPLVLDFDTDDISSLRQNKVYKAIGKRSIKPHTISSGYKIVLTRAKRDNYLQTLIQYHDFFIERGLEPPTFTVERIVLHSYGSDELNAKNEFFKQELKQQTSLNMSIESSEKLFNQREKQIADRTNQIISNTINRYLPKVALNKLTIERNVNGFLNVINDIQNQISELNPFNIEVPFEQRRDVFEISQKIKEQNNFPLFKERTLYRNCMLAEDSFADKPHEFTEEKIIFYASNKVDLSDENDYQDVYLKEILTNQYKDKIFQTGLNINQKSLDKNTELQQKILQAYKLI